jgi:hypothetical protein
MRAGSYVMGTVSCSILSPHHVALSGRSSLMKRGISTILVERYDFHDRGHASTEWYEAGKSTVAPPLYLLNLSITRGATIYLSYLGNGSLSAVNRAKTPVPVVI